jgi:transcriptional regulator with XRE-family HTH domain
VTLYAGQRLGQLVVARRKAIGLPTAQKLAEAAGVSLRTITTVETGGRTRFNTTTKGAIERALRWAPGSIDTVLGGGEPLEGPKNPDGQSVCGSSGFDLSQLPPDEQIVASAFLAVLLEREQAGAARITQDAEFTATVSNRLAHATDALFDMQVFCGEVPAPWNDRLDQLIQRVRDCLRAIADATDERPTQRTNSLSDIGSTTAALLSASRRLRETAPNVPDTVVRPTHWNRAPNPPDPGEWGVAASRREKKSDHRQEDH